MLGLRQRSISSEEVAKTDDGSGTRNGAGPSATAATAAASSRSLSALNHRQRTSNPELPSWPLIPRNSTMGSQALPQVPPDKMHYSQHQQQLIQGQQRRRGSGQDSSPAAPPNPNLHAPNAYSPGVPQNAFASSRGPRPSASQDTTRSSFSAVGTTASGKARAKKAARWDVFGNVLNTRLSAVPYWASSTTVDARQDRAVSRLDMRPAQRPQHISELNFAIVGAESVGKSTFIAKALNLPPDTPANSLPAKGYTMNGNLYAVSLVEVPTEDVQFTDDTLTWSTAKSIAVPQTQGAVVLYDVVNAASILTVPRLLNAFKAMNIPCMLVACKCDHSHADRELDVMAVEHTARQVMDNLCAFQVSHLQADVQQLCISSLLRAVVYGQTATAPSTAIPPRPRATSNTASTIDNVSSPTGSASRGLRISTSQADLRGFNNKYIAGEADSPTSIQQPNVLFPVSPPRAPRRTNNIDKPLPLSPPSTARPSPPPHPPPPTSLPAPPSHQAQQQRMQQQSRVPLQSQVAKEKLPLRVDTGHRGTVGLRNKQSQDSSFLILDESPMRGVTHPAQFSYPTEQKPASFHELVAYLLSPPETTKDQQFVSIFLAFYRMFAAPFVLLEAIKAHFDIIGGDEVLSDPAEDEDLRHRDLVIIGQWINTYPGDFAHDLAKSKLQQFMLEASHVSKFFSIAQEITLALDLVRPDDDTRWANTDAGLINISPVKSKNRKNTFLSVSSVDSADIPGDPLTHISTATSSSSTTTATANKVGAAVKPSPIESNSRESIVSAVSSVSSLSSSGEERSSVDSGPPRPSLGLDGAPLVLPRAADAVYREATTLVPAPLEPITKDSWRALMAAPDDAIARELTRLDWIMFSCIRPRDLIRHVLIPVFDRHLFPCLVNVSRMIDHFNYLAFWVTNIILFRDKPKHRAVALEKLMRVARKLRTYNNYNSLGAVVAGIQGTAVHRLALTKDLVPEEIQRDFMKLEVLMSTPKGHAAYRLAWENSRSERIPFFPLHRRDLLTAEAGGKTFVVASSAPDQHHHPHAAPDEPAKINWKKLTVMGEALLSIQRAQNQPYTGLEENEALRKLILNLDIAKDEDELYERSLAIEPGAGPGGDVRDPARRLLNWFGRY